MKYQINIILCLVLFILSACTNSGFENDQRKKKIKYSTAKKTKELVVDLQEFLGKQSKSKLLEVTIDNDQYFKRTKTYFGYKLRPLIASIIKDSQIDTANSILVFECSDGYSASIDIAKALADKEGYIAVKDKDAIGNKKWIDSLESRFAPYYLVWQHVDSSDHSYPWPYGFKTMALLPSMSRYKSIYPFGNPDMIKGFSLFVENCNKCHAVNHVGGVMGPEFNVPKNITEYWKEGDILNFALDPKSFRSSSKMPPMKGVLSVDEIKEIIAYLHFIAAKKTAN